MTNHNNDYSDADISTSQGISPVWLVPLLAVVVGGWLIYQEWRNQGPVITLYFDSAAGLEAGQTKIKTRDVEVGEVSEIELRQGVDGVVVTARMENSAAHLLRKDSQFWVVRPRITNSGVSGLSTLFSGSYIQLEAGSEKNTAREFEGLSDPPVTPAGTPGLHVTLNSSDEFAYSVGDTVTYKGIPVGKFEDVFFNIEERVVYYNVFIEAPYHRLLKSNTRFWDVSGVRFDLTANGVSFSLGSLQSMLSNSVTFGVPDGEITGQAITERAYFNIYGSYEEAITPSYQYAAEYVILVSDTVRGLSVGAPVEYRGIQIGQVKAINFTIPGQGGVMQHDYRIPVLIDVEPGKIGLPDTQEGLNTVISQHELWVKQGLRARLQTGNLLTGRLFVELQHYPELGAAEMTEFAGYQVLPSTLDDFGQLTQKAGQVMDKFNKLELEQLTANATEAMDEFADAAQSLRQASDAMFEFVGDAEQQQLVKQLTKTMQSIEELTQSFSHGSQSYDQLVATLSAMEERMKGLQLLLNQLNQRPNSLVFTGDHEDDPQPKARQ